MKMVLILKNRKWHFDEQLLSNIQQKNNYQVRSILTSNDLCKVTDSNRSTLLHYASAYGNANITQYLIDSGVNVNSEDIFGRTPLLLAVMCNRAEISAETIDVLLEAKANFLKDDIQGNYPLQYIVDNQAFDQITIVKKFFGRLAEYCLNDSQLMSDLLIKANCPLERVIYLNNASITEMMIQAGYVVDEPHPVLGHTALHVATTLMDFQNIQVLMKYGADVTARTGHRLIPLTIYLITCRYRAHLRNSKIMKLLMNEYFRVTDKADDIAFIVKHILQLGDEETIRHMLNFDKVDLSNVRGDHGNSALHYLAMNDNANVTKALESHITNVNVRNQSGCTPLHYATVARNASTVRVFLENGANVNDKSHIGNTPLLALFYTLSGRRYTHDRDVVEILLQYNADIQVFIPDTRDTMFDYTVRHGRYDLAELLLSKLAFQEEIGEPIIHLIRSKIDAHRTLKDHYDLCRGQLEAMKSSVIYESITLFKLLRQSEQEIVRCYLYNEELLEKLENFNTMYCSNSYYYDILRNRIAIALPKIKLVQDVTKLIFDLIGSHLKRNYLVVCKIIDYLRYEDMIVLNPNKNV